MSEEFVIKTSIWKTIFLALPGCLIFVIAGVFLIFGVKGLIANVVGIISIGFFGFGCFVSLYRCLDRRPLIVIDEKGINDRRLGVGRIAWEDIESVKLSSGSTNGSIFLKLVNSKKSLKILSNASNKKFNLFNGDLELGILNLNLTPADTEPQKIFEIILNYIPEKQIKDLDRISEIK